MQAFPARPLRDREPGRINYRLLVDHDGRPTDRFVEPPTIAEYRETACRLRLEHARFEPALDASGMPIATYCVDAIVYQLGG